MLTDVVKLISKTIVVAKYRNTDRYSVICYVNGKWDATHPPTTEPRAMAIAQCIADGDDVRKMLAEFDAQASKSSPSPA